MFKQLTQSFTDLAGAPRALWYVIGAFVVDSAAYFGILTLMTIYLGKDLGWSDTHAGMAVSVFTMLVTLFMLGVGSLTEALGLRRAIVCALLVTILGRTLYCLAASSGGSSSMAIMAMMALLLVACGSGMLQPVCYSGVKQYTDAKTSAMGYAMIYAVMNLGIVGIGTLSSWIRPGVQNILDGHQPGATADPMSRSLAQVTGSGVQAVNWLCCGLTVLTLLLFLLLMTRKTEAAKLRPDAVLDNPSRSKPPLWQRFKSYFLEGPFGNKRFVFFIFMLLPVRTLFAHQWLTMPQYILRSYPKEVGDKMEWLINWINPAIIFVGVPVLTALTRRTNVYTMMIIGSLVSALPTFLLCYGPSLPMLLTYFVIFSIGEALWSARFLEYASELAPPGRVAQFMGLAQVPWLMAKGTTGFYSGYLLSTYCPENTPVAQLHTGTLWFIYGCIAMSSPLGLWLARKWVAKGMHAPASPAAGR
ncbi:MAG: MFS transporter [Verrucomicrobiota bacterium]